MKVVLYRRISKEDKSKNQHGYDGQEMEIQRWLSSNPDAEVVGEYGEFFSGRGHYSKRKQFNLALDHCKLEKATLLLTKPDRLARDVESGAHILNNYKVVFTSNPDADTITKHILLSVAQAESDNTSIRQKAVAVVIKKKGIKVGRASPNYGMKTGNGTKLLEESISNRKFETIEKSEYVIDEVKKALKYLGKRPTQSKVSTLLNDMKVPTPTGKGVWSQSKLQRVLDRHNVNIFNIRG
jgi:DNA invertase Pin-like site-specific DNA recombinase